MSDKVLVTQRRILAGTINLLRSIRHFVVSNFVIPGFDCIFRGHSTREPAPVVCNDYKDDLLYSTGPYRNLH